ncbi:MAG TPA: histidine kinase [Pilimelia sp.]|nr:histidine kinase [Pilimelia sp.]
MVAAWSRLARGTLAQDAALAAVSLAGGLLLIALDAINTVYPHRDTPRTHYVLPLVAACVAVLLRRVATRTSLALGSAAVTVDVAIGASLGTILVYTQVLYDACVYGSPRLWRRLLAGSLVLTAVATVAGLVLLRRWQGVGLGVPFALAGVLPVVTGISVRQYRDQAAAERARAEQTARLAELDRRQAVLAERTRMARELHDLVANHLSAVAIHATAVLSLRDLDGDQVRQALTTIRESGVRGLAEMRRMIELLRDADEEATGEPARAGLAGLDELLARVRAAGLEVTVQGGGAPPPLPVSVDVAAYRIVQESLTNALKHGDGSARVAIRYAPEGLRLTISNPLGPAGRTPSVPGAGAGLIGMRERAELVAGSLRAGPAGHLWQVHAELPTGPR